MYPLPLVLVGIDNKLLSDLLLGLASSMAQVESEFASGRHPPLRAFVNASHSPDCSSCGLDQTATPSQSVDSVVSWSVGRSWR